jgi:hypothetical protein
MKKAVPIIVLGGFLAAFPFPSLALDIPVRDAQVELLKHFNLVVTPGFYVQVVDEVPSQSQLGELGNTFVKENNLHLDYLSKVALGLFDRTNPAANQPDAVRERFERAKESGAFLDLVTDLFTSYLKSKGHGVSGWPEKPKESLPWSDLKTMAVRFFMPVRILDTGGIATRICVTGEGMIDYPLRNYQLEGFVFNAIFTDVKRHEDSVLIARLQEHAKLGKALRLSTDKDIALKRACGVIWALFYNDESFDKILREAYQRQKGYLPFAIAE